MAVEILGPYPYWLPLGRLQEIMTLDYAGDRVNSRILDLEDDYNVVEIYDTGPFSNVQDHLARAWAIGDAYGCLWNTGGNNETRHATGAPADDWFQGKVVGTTTITLSAVGATPAGTNELGHTYRVLAWQFRGLRS